MGLTACDVLEDNTVAAEAGERLFWWLERELLNWVSELLANSLDWGKLGNVAMCCNAEGRSEVVVGTTLGREPAEGSEGEGSVLDAGTEEVAAMS